jgi:DNA polymerase-3 subunit gamma/tau
MVMQPEFAKKIRLLCINQVVDPRACFTIPLVSYQVFARKYRPATFDDVLGQDHVVRTLKNAIAQNRLAHAYLFVGPRGTGKTSTARIFAKALNGPGGPKVDFDPNDPVCQQIAEGTSLDVVEIDGASNNGVDEVRSLRESVNYAPMSGQFKIYYIDEVHMLTNQAFNALLKTLEEPPPHVKFIFATTEVHKILPTILSRCQRFDLRPIPTETIAQHLLHIASLEGVTLDQAAAWAIAKGADGGMRDAQSMLDQLVAFCGSQITEPDVLNIFGFTSRETIASLCDAIFSKNTAAALQIIQRESSTGRDVSQLLNELIGALRAVIVAKVDPNAPNEGIPQATWQQLLDAAKHCKPDRLLAVIDVFAETEGRMKWASNRKLHLELGIIKAIQVVGDARVSDIINVLAAASGFFPENSAPPVTPSSTPSMPAAPAVAVSPVVPDAPIAVEEAVLEIPAPPVIEPAPVAEMPAPVASPAAIASDTPMHDADETKPEPVFDPVAAAAKAARDGDIMAAFDAMIDSATDDPARDEPPVPIPAPVIAPVVPEPKKEIPRAADDFHKDPLIQKALEIFAAKIVTP